MNKRFLLLLSVIIMLSMVVACGDDVSESDAPVVQATEEIAEVAEEEAQITEEIAEAAEEEAQATEIKSSGNEIIPRECFESDEAWEECGEQGLFPDECFDEEGYLLNECQPSEEPEIAEEESEVTEVNSSADLIPWKCMQNQAAFYTCTEQGLTIPNECVDTDGGIFTKCIAPIPPPEEGAAHNGFDPAIHAFSFENYGNEQNFTNLTEEEMERMFGPQVCANQADGCTLTPPARHWMEQMNQSMGGGHCEGMAVLSGLMFYNQQDPTVFGGSTVSDLTIQGNDALQREIAYWFVTQFTTPGGKGKINQSPSVVLDTLIETFNQGQASTETWAMGLYKRDWSGGHAILPYAVEDQGNGIFHVYVYDNNYANQAQIMIIDRNTETWQYKASPNPSIPADLYEGDASTHTLELVSISPRLQMQEPHFDQASVLDGKTPGLAAPLLDGHDAIQVWLHGDANLLITTEDGRRVGSLEDGTFVNEIEGAEPVHLKLGVDVWNADQEPVYVLPADIDGFAITVDGSQLEEGTSAEIAVIGSGFYMGIEDLWIDPGEQDLITMAKEGEEYFIMNYESDYSDSPDMLFGIETDEADYAFVVRGADIESGGSFNVVLDFANGDFILDTTDQQETGIYELLVLRIDDEGEYIFGNDEIPMEPSETMYVNFLDWEGEGSKMYLDFDNNGDGVIDAEMVLEDESELFYESLSEDSEEEVTE